MEDGQTVSIFMKDEPWFSLKLEHLMPLVKKWAQHNTSAHDVTDWSQSSFPYIGQKVYYKTALLQPNDITP